MNPLLTHRTTSKISLATCFFIILYVAAACRQSHVQAGEAGMKSPYIDFKVDTFLEIPLNNKYTYYATSPGLLASPVEKNKFWIMNLSGAEPIEIDTKTGTIVPLSQKFGEPTFFGNRSTVQNVYSDPFQPEECWFQSQQTGIFHYDHKSGKGQYLPFNGQQIMAGCLAFSKDQVWIGTSQGLWVYDRHNGSYLPVDASPQLWVYKIEVQENGKVLIPDGYLYDPASKCWEKTDHYMYTEGSYNYQAEGLKLPYTGGSYTSATGGENAWHCNSLYWFCYDKKANKVQPVRPLFHADARLLLADGEYLYAFTQNSFWIINQRYLRTSRAGDPAFFTKMERLYALADSLHLNTYDAWYERKAKMAYLHTQFPGETDPFLCGRMEELSRLFNVPTDVDSLRTLLREPDLDTLMTDRIYETAIREFVRKGQLKDALEWGETYQKKRPASMYMKQIAHSLLLTEAAVYQMDAADQADRPVYENLWEKSLILKQYCTEQQFIPASVCYDYWLAMDIWKQIVQQFPACPRAEDADFNLIAYSLCYEGEDGSDHPEEVKRWKEFLRKYPKARHRAEVLGRMAWAMGRSEKELRDALRLIEEAERLRPELYSPLTNDNLVYFKEDILKRLDLIDLAFSVQLSKTTIKKGESITAVFTVKNNSKDSRTISNFPKAKLPGFLVEIYPETEGNACVRPVAFIESTTLSYSSNPKDYTDRTLSPGAEYAETWDLTQIARKHNQSNIGRFVFDQPGVYYVRAHWYAHGEDRAAEPVRLEVQ